MTDVSNNNFQNLVSLTAVIFIFAIIGNIASLAKQYPPQYVKFAAAQSKSTVQGYVRPGQARASQLPNAAHSVTAPSEVKKIDLLAELSPQQVQTLQQRFDQATALLHAKQYDYAIIALDEVVSIQPRLPEAHTNLGFSYLGLKQFKSAVQAFSRAIDLRPNQVNAYYGLAESFEGLKDYEAALGAMRSYIHISAPDDPFLAKARAAIWEWETKLGRKPQIEDADSKLPFDNKRFVSPHNH